MDNQAFRTFIYLIISLFIIHSLYILFITPFSNEYLSIASEAGTTVPRNIFVILKDIEQEICLILFFWASFYLVEKIYSYRKILDHDNLTPIKSSIDKFDIDLSIVRYISWAIPSIGFIGTVRGIGEALTKASEALAGDISGMTDSLGVAINSTFVALFLSIFLVLIISIAENLQDQILLKKNTKH